jgi:hypothetical protein
LAITVLRNVDSGILPELVINTRPVVLCIAWIFKCDPRTLIIRGLDKSLHCFVILFEVGFDPLLQVAIL